MTWHPFAKLLLLMLFTSGLMKIQPVAAQQSSGQMAFEPRQVNLPQGESRTIEVWVSGVVDAYGCDVIVTYDPAVIRVSGLKSGGFLDSGFTILSNVNDDKGRMEFAVTQIDPSPPKSGDGILFSFVIQGLSGGSSSLKITKSTISQRDGTLLEMGRSTASVTVIASTPTRTPVMTAGPIYLAPTRLPTNTVEIMTTVPQPVEPTVMLSPTLEMPTATHSVATATNTTEPTTAGPTATLVPISGLTTADQFFLNSLWWLLLIVFGIVVIILLIKIVKPGAPIK